MKMKDISTLNLADVNLKLEEIRAELFNSRIQKTTSGIEKPHLVKGMKKDVARLLTQKTNLLKNISTNNEANS